MCKADRRFKGLSVALICVLWVIPCVLVFSPFWYSWMWVDRGCNYPDSLSCGWHCTRDPNYSTATTTLCSWCNSAGYPNVPYCVRDTTNGVSRPAGYDCAANTLATGYSSNCNACVYGPSGAVLGTVCQQTFPNGQIQQVSDNGILAVAVVFTVLAAIGIFVMGMVGIFCCNRITYASPGGLAVVPEDKGAVYRPAVAGANV